MNVHLQRWQLGLLLLLGGCVTVPTGPSVLVLPGTGRSFDQFRYDDFECRQFASAQIGGTTPGKIAADSGAKSAAVGTIVGAAVGAAVDGGRGAAVGAGAGLGLGALAGTGAAEASASNAQQRYDYAFIQCMYARGHRVPVSSRTVYSPSRPNYPPPPPPPYN